MSRTSALWVLVAFFWSWSVGLAAQPIITVGYIGTTFATNSKAELVRSDVGAQHLAAFMLAVDEINTSDELDVLIRPEVSLGNIDYISSIQDLQYDGAAAARDIYLSQFLPQVVISSDSSVKALSSAVALQALGVPTLFTAERSSALSHANVYPEVFRMTASESQDGVILRMLCRHFAWSRIAVVYSEDDFGTDTYFVLRTQAMDGDVEDQLEELAVESFPTHQHGMQGEITNLLSSGATIFVVLISKATSVARLLVQGFRAGLFSQGTQVLAVCQEPNTKVISEAQKLLEATESIDEVMKGYMSVQFYPKEHLSTPRGLQFASKFRALNATRTVVDATSDTSSCTTTHANRTLSLSKYPLYHVPGYPLVCTGIANFTTEDISPEILFTYDAVIAVGKALHYLLGHFGVTNSSADLNNMLYDIMVANATNRLLINGASGSLKWYEGYAKAENFAEGERTVGHSFQILSYLPSNVLASSGVHVEDGLALVGYYNGTVGIDTSNTIHISSYQDVKYKAITFCVSDVDTVDGLPCKAALFRTSIPTLPPRDMQPEKHIFSLSPIFKAVLAALGAVCAVAAIFCLATLAWLRKDHFVKYTQPPVLALVFFGYFILSIKILANQASFEPGFCVGDKWISHIGFSSAFLPLVVKLWRLDKIVNNKAFKKVKITDTDALLVCFQGMLVLIVLLVIDSSVAYIDSPLGFLLSKRTLAHNQNTFTYFCGLSNHPISLVFTALIYCYQCVVMAVAMYYLYKTRRLPGNVNEIGTIAPLIFAITVLVIVTTSIVCILDFEPHVNILIVNLACGFGVLISIYYYWIPKCTSIFWEHHKKRVAAAAEADSFRRNGGMSFKHNKIEELVESKEEARATDLMSRLRQQQLPLPSGPTQEQLVSELLALKGSTAKAVFCQNQIGYLDALLVALSQLSDSSNNSSSNARSSLSKDSSSVIGDEESRLDTAASLITLTREKPQSSFIQAPEFDEIEEPSLNKAPENKSAVENP